jgi:predicted NodU family carbamoyl transferase
MRVLGLVYNLWISSAALVCDGVVVAAASEERFWIKKYRGFPRHVDQALKV